MLIIISPAKKLDFETEVSTVEKTEIRFPNEAKQLIGYLKPLSPAKLMKLMSISKELAELNANRFFFGGTGPSLKMNRDRPYLLLKVTFLPDLTPIPLTQEILSIVSNRYEYFPDCMGFCVRSMPLCLTALKWAQSLKTSMETIYMLSGATNYQNKSLKT